MYKMPLLWNASSTARSLHVKPTLAFTALTVTSLLGLVLIIFVCAAHNRLNMDGEMAGGRLSD